MRWYDYAVCLFIADIASAMIVAGSPLVIIPALWYIMYEDFRERSLNK